jgi:2-amino-4-hydroxy-6-hydroxymethyldihydropteridine diphosphokinase
MAFFKGEGPAPPGAEPCLVVLGLGSNRGDSRNILEGAVTALGDILRAPRRASVFETEPLYVTDQNRFLNTAVSGRYQGSPRELLRAVQAIEAAFGRDREKERRWGERTLDIDILLFGDLVVSDPPALEIPHPRLTERRFALTPLLELVSDAADPRTGVSYRSLCAGLPPQGIYYAGGTGYTVP